MAKISSLCVFCGSRPGARSTYRDTAIELGRSIATRGVRLVYGGGNVGLMGLVADSALEAGGEVHGVIPQSIVDMEVAHTGLNALDIVGSMHERKARMAELADGFVALPGGLGTLEELFEVSTWFQLGFHNKPIALLDVDNYYELLSDFLDKSVEEEFVSEVHRTILPRCESVDALWKLLDEAPPQSNTPLPQSEL